MSFRPLPAQASTQLLRQARPLQMLFAEAQRICRLQQLLESQLQPAARPYCHVASWRGGCLLLIVTDGHTPALSAAAPAAAAAGFRRIRELSENPFQGATHHVHTTCGTSQLDPVCRRGGKPSRIRRHRRQSTPAGSARAVGKPRREKPARINPEIKRGHPEVASKYGKESFPTLPPPGAYRK